MQYYDLEKFVNNKDFDIPDDLEILIYDGRGNTYHEVVDIQIIKEGKEWFIKAAMGKEVK